MPSPDISLLSIGGLSLAIDQKPVAGLPKNYRPFLSSGIASHTIKYDPQQYDHIPIYHDDSLNIDILEFSKDREIIELRNLPPQCQIIFSSDRTALHNYGATPFPPPPVILASMIRFLKGKGIFMHAFAGIYKNDGFVFCGTSESGKTTLAKKWGAQDVTVLCDERIIITEGNNGFNVHASPWPGDLDLINNKTAPLKFIAVLKPSGPAMDRIADFAEFVPLVLPLTYHRPWDEEFTFFTLSIFGRIFEKIPVFSVNREKVDSPSQFFSKIISPSII